MAVIPSIKNRTLALAGLYQCTYLVHQIAAKGSADQSDAAACIGSLFAFDPETIEGAYGGAANLRAGLTVLRSQIGRAGRHADLAPSRYAVALLYLERKLEKRQDMVNAIREGVKAAHEQLEYFDGTHANVIAKLSDVYQQTISRLGPRIIVRGEHVNLSNPENASKIRALLLAGIRAAVLWRQTGGNRWRLLFGRSRIVEEAGRLSAAL